MITKSLNFYSPSEVINDQYIFIRKKLDFHLIYSIFFFLKPHCLMICQEKYLNFYSFEFLYLLFRSFVHYLKLQGFIISLLKEGFLMVFPKDCYLKIIDQFVHLEGLELFFVPRNNCYPLRIILSITCLKFKKKF